MAANHKLAGVVLTLMLSLLVPLSVAMAGDDGVTVRRFAIVAGINDGGAGRVPLRYALTDALTVSKVLTELGGVARNDRVLLLDANARAFNDALGSMRELLVAAKAPNRRLEVLFYYSGHSDEEGLLLGEERIPYPELRQKLEALPADVRIAILDSCSSGALTRRKGGKRLAPFLIDASASVRGHAFLTSSSENEAAQESDRIGGSFFTHFFVSGLRGAADVSGDGRVTLTEAYQFAFDETLKRTEQTQSGPQHPAYDINLAGSGDLVLTDLRGTAASIALDPEVEGRLFVRTADGRLIAELQKPAGRVVELGVPPGEYEVTVASEGKLYRAEINVAAGTPTLVGNLELVAERLEATAARGNAQSQSQSPGQSPQPPAGSGESGYAVSAMAASTDASSVATHTASASDGLDSGMAAGGAADTGDGIGEGAAGPEDAAGPSHGRRLVAHAGEALSDIRDLALDVGDALLPPGSDPEGYQTLRFSWSLVPGVGNDRVPGLKTIKRFSLNVLLGSGDVLRGLELGLIANMESELVQGFQASAFLNLDMGRLEGFQAAGFLNVASGGGRGAMFAGLGNIGSEEFQGAQVAGLFNCMGGGGRLLQVSGGLNLALGNMEGFQMGAIVNVLRGESARFGQIAGLANFVSQPSSGLQLAGGANIALRGISGAQLAGAFNFARGEEARLLQLAGGGNLTTASIRGFQGSAAFNYAGGIHGAQAAVVNISGDVSGAQIGVVNIATGAVNGSQVGLVNVAGDYESGVPVGLFNYVRSGQLHLDVWGSDLSPVNMSVKLGSRNFYTMLTFGAARTADEKVVRGIAMFGVGGTLPLGDHLFLAGDLSAGNVFLVRNYNNGHAGLPDENFNGVYTLRLMVGAKLFEHLGAFAGLSANGYWTADRYDTEYGELFARSRMMYEHVNGTELTRVWPGAFAGLQF